MKYILNNGMSFQTSRNLSKYRYLAVDSDGEVYAYTREPHLPTKPPEGCDTHIWDTLEDCKPLCLGYVAESKAGSFMSFEETEKSLTRI